MDSSKDHPSRWVQWTCGMLVVLALAIGLSPVLVQAFPATYRMALPVETAATHTGADALARITAVMERLGGSRLKQMSLAWHTDLFLMAEHLSAAAMQMLDEDTELSLACMDHELDATITRAEAVCLEIAATYLGPDY
jgi:hypothetical protein